MNKSHCIICVTSSPKQTKVTKEIFFNLFSSLLYCWDSGLDLWWFWRSHPLWPPRCTELWVLQQQKAQRLKAIETILSSLKQIFLSFAVLVSTVPLPVWEQMSKHSHTLSKPATSGDARTPDLFLIHIQSLWIGDRDIWLVLALHPPHTRDTNSELDLTLQFPADQQGWHNYYAGCATHRHRDTHSGVIQLELSAGEDFWGGTYAKVFHDACVMK